MYRSFLVSFKVAHLGARQLCRGIQSSSRIRREEATSLIPFARIWRKQESVRTVLQTTTALEKTPSSDKGPLPLERRMEKFIPVTRRVLVSKLIAEEGLLNGKERHLMERFAAALDTCFHQRFYAMLEETKVKAIKTHQMQSVMRFN